MRVLMVLGGLAAFVVVIVGVYAIQYYTADARGRVAANEVVKSGASRLTNYNMFFDRCAAIQGHEGTLDALRDELKTATLDGDKARINANITGVSSQRAQSIAQYNQDALKWTSGQFRDAELPYQIPTGAYDGKAKTTCAFE